jgi:hypothetical protein
MNTVIEKKGQKLYWIVLSDLLRSEQAGTPIDYARYCAKYRNRRDVFSALVSDRIAHLIENNKYGLSFNGLVLTKAPAAKRVLADCRRMYNALRDIYQVHVHDKRPTIAEAANTLEPPLAIDRALLAVAMLTRDSGANVVAEYPLTPNSKINGNQDLLEQSFASRVKARVRLLHKPRLDGATRAPWNPLATPPHRRRAPIDADSLFSEIDELGSEEAKDSWEKCALRVASDPDGTISAAKDFVEAICKQILHSRALTFSPSAGLPDLYKQIKVALVLDAAAAPNRALQTIFQGCAAVVTGLAELRNAIGEGHGKEPGSAKASRRHGRLAVALGGAMGTFLLAADDARKLP